uniref:Uncharacterized protein n=1 Tax=Propithecus coquereli TaxID=379532 RepID=A0A2K6GN31_PROCO
MEDLSQNGIRSKTHSNPCGCMGKSGQPHKRRKTSDGNETEDHLESLICKVGEKSACSLESNLEGLAGVLEADLPNYKSKILRLLCTVYVCKRFMNPGDNVLSTLKRFGKCSKDVFHMSLPFLLSRASIQMK